MEEEKIVDVFQSQGVSGCLAFALWQWQSDLDPWKEKDAAKWTWQNYSDDNCRIIEQAFFQNKEIADLKDYEIDLKKMLQVRKDDKHRIRRVRRQEKSRLAMEISKPVAVAQKTMNEAFGTIQQFLDYIMKRTPEAYALYQRLKELPLESKDIEFGDVIQEVINCIERGAENREKTKARSASKKTCIEQGKEIVNEIKKNSKSLKNFFETILKVYTMNTFMYLWLNELLRSEDWEEINVLTPYLVCLVYTFKLSTYIMKHQEPQGLVDILLGYVAKQKLYLYRGAVLTKEDLAFYDTKKVKYFSWNGVTSTSRKKSVAQDFFEAPLGKLRVIFLIETDFASPEDCEGMIDITKYSRYPDEEEIIFAPGTVFQLLKTRLIEKDYYEISLKVVKKFEETKESIAFLGALQDQAISKDKAVIDGLPSLKNMKLLHLLKGNKLIRKLEIINSGIEEHIIEDIENMRGTTNVKKQDIKLIDNTIVVSGLSTLVHYFSLENLNNIIISNKIRFQKTAVKFEEKKKDWKTNLILKEEALRKLQKDGLFKEFWENVKQDIKATSLSVSMNNIQIESSEFKDFLESLKEMKHLESLMLTVNSNNIELTEDLSHFCNTIESLSTLKRLSIELALSDKGLKSFKKALSCLKSLHYLHLDFKSCKQVSDEGLDHLKTALLPLKSLQHLSLDLENCDKISDEGLCSFKTALQSLISLQTLSLDFTDCIKISNNGFNHLLISLKSLKYLEHLSLNFNLCNGLSNEGLSHIKTALSSFPDLENLSLDFTRCDRVSDEGLNHLQLGLLSVGSLRYLSLNFTRCFKISDEGLDQLSAAIFPLKSLRNLSLDFTKCDKISNEGIENLNIRLISLTSLQSLSLYFSDCDRITDQGLNYLNAGLSSLSSLQHLSLDFTRCDMISNEGFNHLSIGLPIFKALKKLFLGFGWCCELSDDVVNHLKTPLTSLISLEYLSLDFRWCDKITDEGLKSLASSLTPLVSLQHLALNVSSCQQISDKGLDHLKNVLILLTDLRHFSIDLSDCEQISHDSLSRFRDALKSIQYLDCIL